MSKEQLLAVLIVSSLLANKTAQALDYQKETLADSQETSYQVNY